MEITETLHGKPIIPMFLNWLFRLCHFLILSEYFKSTLFAFKIEMWKMHDQRNVQYENRKMLLCFIRALNEATTVKNLTKSTDANNRYVHGMLFIFETNFTRYSHQMLFKYLWQYSTEHRLWTKKNIGIWKQQSTFRQRVFRNGSTYHMYKGKVPCCCKQSVSSRRSLQR